uniref:NINE protein n=1 Tax=Paenarthrobacter ureafaciens TaxID=37931 RepID=UPI003F49A885
MKGNRLNTAANVGTFVTSRQQLKQQQQMAGSMDAMLQIQHKQALDADYDRLQARMDRAVAEGRMTRDEADTAMELEWFNKLHKAPETNSKIMATIGQTLERNGTPAGWYMFKEPGQGVANTIARYWTGTSWSMDTLPLAEAKKRVREEFISAAENSGLEPRSRKTAGLLAVLLLGSFGVHRFYLRSPGMGILMVIAFFVLMFVGAFWLVTIWGIIEGIMILSKSKVFERDGKGVPLN